MQSRDLYSSVFKTPHASGKVAWLDSFPTYSLSPCDPLLSNPEISPVGQPDFPTRPESISK